MASGAPPLFVSVIVCAAALNPTPVGTNEIPAVGESETPAGAMPVPPSITVWLLYWSATVNTPVVEPTLFGTNMTTREQLECAFSEFPHPFTTVKSPLVTCAEINWSAVSPEFVTVTCWLGLAVFSTC
jgi:hypothetical protein